MDWELLAFVVIYVPVAAINVAAFTKWRADQNPHGFDNLAFYVSYR